MNQAEQIDYLNSMVKVQLKPSLIQGVGLFALRDLPKDTLLGTHLAPRFYRLTKGNLGKLFPEVRQLLLERWPGMLRGEGFAWPDVYLQGYINHSSDSNYAAATDLTLRDIKAGEEITQDYRSIPQWWEVFSWLKNDGTESKN